VGIAKIRWTEFLDVKTGGKFYFKNVKKQKLTYRLILKRYTNSNTISFVFVIDNLQFILLNGCMKSRNM